MTLDDVYCRCRGYRGNSIWPDAACSWCICEPRYADSVGALVTEEIEASDEMTVEAWRCRRLLVDLTETAK